jgi:hypothetical protein
MHGGVVPKQLKQLLEQNDGGISSGVGVNL